MGIVKSMTKEMLKEIGNRSREFYEFVLPPVDMRLVGDELLINIDLPGFNKKDIKLTMSGNILSINAEKNVEEKTDGIMCNQRPRVIDKKIMLPVEIKEGEESTKSVRYENGVLSLIIPVKKNGKDINIE